MSEIALLVGGRGTGKNTFALLALGPAQLRSWHEPALPPGTPNPIPRIETGLATTLQVATNLNYVGVGLDLFAARSAHKSLAGAALSFQLGWLGK
jgi:hypothetical protein